MQQQQLHVAVQLPTQPLIDLIHPLTVNPRTCQKAIDLIQQLPTHLIINITNMYLLPVYMNLKIHLIYRLLIHLSTEHLIHFTTHRLNHSNAHHLNL